MVSTLGRVAEIYYIYFRTYAHNLVLKTVLTQIPYFVFLPFTVVCVCVCVCVAEVLCYGGGSGGGRGGDGPPGISGKGGRSAKEGIEEMNRAACRGAVHKSAGARSVTPRPQNSAKHWCRCSANVLTQDSADVFGEPGF